MTKAKYLTFVLLICLAWLLQSCGKIPGKEEPGDIKNVEIAYYSSDTDPEEGYPLLAYESDGSVLLHYHNTASPNSAYFYYKEPGNSTPHILIVGKDRLVFAPLNSRNEVSSPVILLFADDEFSELFIGELDMNSGTYSVKETIPLINKAATKAKYNFGDEYKAMLLHSFQEAFSKNQDLGDALNIASLGSEHVDIITRMTQNILTLAFAASLRIMYDDAGEELQGEIEHMASETMVDVIFGNTVDLALRFLPYKEVHSLISHAARKICLGNGKKEEDITDRDVESVADGLGTSMFSRMKSMEVKSMLFNYSEVKEQLPYNVSLSILNVGETFVTVSGYDAQSENWESVFMIYSDQGYDVIRLRDGQKQTFHTSDFKEKQLLLEPATEYAISAYLITFAGGHICSSKYEPVCTRGAKIELSTNEVYFTTDGGSQTVEAVFGDRSTISVINKLPLWCKVSLDKSGITITANKGLTEETCEIVLEIVSSYNEKKTATIKVHRNAVLSWDKTKWKFDCTPIWPEWTGSDDGVLTVNSVANKSYSCDFLGTADPLFDIIDYNNIGYDQNGDLVIEIKGHWVFDLGVSGWGTKTFYTTDRGVFHRVDHNHATCIFRTTGDAGRDINDKDWEIQGVLIN